jgi:type IV secretion system protein VirB10
MLTGIHSDLPGQLLAQVREPVYDTVTGRYLLVPQGAKLIGTYDHDVVYGQDRVLIAWTRLVFPNGTSLQLEGMPGVDLTGYAGLKDKVNHHLWPLFRAVLLSSVLSMGARIPFGSPENYHETLAQEWARDFGSAANRAGQNIVNRELNRKPTIDIRPGMSLNVFVHRDMLLQPYTDAVAGGRP